MKYVISYECSSDSSKFASEFEVESEQVPSISDDNVIQGALRDSVKLHTSGLGAINITSIKLAS